MKNILIMLMMSATIGLAQTTPDPVTIIKKVDANMYSDTRIFESEMIIHGKRSDRSLTMKVYSEGSEKSFTEYLSPDREKGTKMLKLENNLWIYSPESDRTIQLSGHMLRQSVMGSDLSYEDMMEDRKLLDMYNVKALPDETLNDRKTYVLELIAKVDDVNYYKRKIWIDQERYVTMQEELFAKSGTLLKKTVMSDIIKVGNRWYPKKINYKDMLSDGNGTDFIMNDIQFDVPIPDYIFTKAVLKK